MTFENWYYLINKLESTLKKLPNTLARSRSMFNCKREKHKKNRDAIFTPRLQIFISAMSYKLIVSSFAYTNHSSTASSLVFVLREGV